MNLYLLEYIHKIILYLEVEYFMYNNFSYFIFYFIIFVPCFHFYVNGNLVETIMGADVRKVEETIVQLVSRN